MIQPLCFVAGLLRGGARSFVLWLYLFRQVSGDVNVIRPMPCGGVRDSARVWCCECNWPDALWWPSCVCASLGRCAANVSKSLGVFGLRGLLSPTRGQVSTVPCSDRDSETACCPFVAVVVPRLPRGASFEVEAISLTQRAGVTLPIERRLPAAATQLQAGFASTRSFLSVRQGLATAAVELAVPTAHGVAFDSDDHLAALCTAVSDAVAAAKHAAALSSVATLQIRIYSCATGAENASGAVAMVRST